MPVEERGLSSGRVLKVAMHRRLGQPQETPEMCASAAEGATC